MKSPKLGFPDRRERLGGPDELSLTVLARKVFFYQIFNAQADVGGLLIDELRQDGLIHEEQVSADREQTHAEASPDV